MLKQLGDSRGKTSSTATFVVCVPTLNYEQQTEQHVDVLSEQSVVVGRSSETLSGTTLTLSAAGR